jgi:hypothetical protein
VLTCGAFTAGPALANSSGDAGPSGGTAVEWYQHQRRHAGGTVAAVDGTNLVVMQRDGSTLNVTTTDATAVTTTTRATLADVTPGSFVTVRVRKADDGTVTAKRIDIRPAPDAGSASDSDGWSGWKPWRRGVAGAVESIDPSTGVITLATDDGPVTVATVEGTKVTKTVALSVADVAVGAPVKLKGEEAADGTFSAIRIQVLAAAAEAPPTTELPTTTEPPTTTTPPAADDGGVDDGKSGDDASPSNSRYHGIVLSVDGVTFALTLRDGTVVTVVTSDVTEFRNKLAPNGDDGTPASLADVAVGSWVKVKGSLDGAALYAEKVTVGPDEGNRDGGWDDGRHRGDKAWGDDNWSKGDRDDDGRDDRNDRSGSENGGYSVRSNDRSSDSKGSSGRR